MESNNSNYPVKENTGFIFKNKFKKQDNHPDLKGDVYFDRELLELVLRESTQSIIQIKLGAYKKQTKNGETYLAIYASKPVQQKSFNETSNDDDDIPF
jgi:hypothetical protein